MTKLAVEHVYRPNLPWRPEEVTECGLPAVDVAAVITRDAYVAKVRDLGKQRAAMSTCMTCMQTAERWADWALSPSNVIHRHTESYWRSGKTERIDNELRAIAALIEEHRAEFDNYLNGVAEIPSLSDKRAAKRTAAAYRRGSRRL